jgi:hypothetical protein
VRSASVGFLPQSTDELKGVLATELADAERYAIAYPALSFTLGGTVIAVEAGEPASPVGRRFEQKYAVEGGPRVIGEPVAVGDSESLLFDARPEGTVAFSVESERRVPGEPTVYACRLGGARFELHVNADKRVVGTTLVHGDGAIRFASPADAAQVLGALTGGGAPAATRAEARATVVVLASNARRAGSGFTSPGGSWTATKWTFEDDAGAAEVYVNLQPAMKRGEIAPRERGLGPVAEVLTRALA